MLKGIARQVVVYGSTVFKIISCVSCFHMSLVIGSFVPSTFTVSRVDLLFCDVYFLCDHIITGKYEVFL